MSFTYDMRDKMNAILMGTIDTHELHLLLKEMLIDRNISEKRRPWWTISEHEQHLRLEREIRAIRKELRSRSLAAQLRLPGF